MGSPRSRWEAAVWTDTVILIQIPDWKVASRSREVWVRRSGRPRLKKELNCTNSSSSSSSSRTRYVTLHTELTNAGLQLNLYKHLFSVSHIRRFETA